MTKDSQPKVIHLKDYQPYPFVIDEVFLHFDLNPGETTVKSILKLHRNPEARQGGKDLVLNGEELTLKHLLLNGKQLSEKEYSITNETLTIFNVPDQFKLEIAVIIEPEKNAALSGLYKSRGNYCTQCEAQGFRRITYFPDRPDVLTRFTTTISADKTLYPMLLSNGNLIEFHDLPNDRHWVKWHDPSLKPSYLFALVAGQFDCLMDEFTTMSSRKVQLRLYIEKGNLAQSDFAMQSLKNAMKWDEQTFGREYDLDIYMIVAVSDFNMGAMENKGLNIFNDKYILAKPETATDEDYVNVESVIGHEYFHNWSGNRVTVRDWFQITLKEGLTIFRDQNFTADMTSRAVKRIKDVNVIRNFQFPQDAGPMAHPIRPDSYIEVNNFYTVTVYNKGSEVIRMMETLLGRESFRKAMDLYFSRFDGKAVTTEDFVNTMEETSGLDLTQFRRWYSQAGTPRLEVTDEYDAEQKIYRLHFKQSCPPTPGQSEKKDFHIPVLVGLLDKNGKELPIDIKNQPSSSDHSCILNVMKSQQSFEFLNIPHKPLPSLLRNFSAPVKLNYPYTKEELIFLMQHDTDGFNSWDAGQQLAVKIIFQLIDDYQHHRELKIDPLFIQAFEKILLNGKDKFLTAERLILPAETYLIELMDVADVHAIYNSRLFLRKEIARQLKNQLLQVYHANEEKEYHLDIEGMGKRKLKNLCLSYLTLLEEKDVIELAVKQFQNAMTMTDAMGALISLNTLDIPERSQLLDEFYQRWHKESLVVDKWFSVHASAPLPKTLATVKQLMNHPAFDMKNPNKVRSLIGAFSNFNYICFHDKSGSGYEFLSDQVLIIDKFNPQLSARLVEPLIRWKKFDEDTQTLMRTQLQRIASIEKLSKDVYEIVTKALV